MRMVLEIYTFELGIYLLLLLFFSNLTRIHGIGRQRAKRQP